MTRFTRATLGLTLYLLSIAARADTYKSKDGTVEIDFPAKPVVRGDAALLSSDSLNYLVTVSPSPQSVKSYESFCKKAHRNFSVLKLGTNEGVEEREVNPGGVANTSRFVHVFFTRGKKIEVTVVNKRGTSIPDAGQQFFNSLKLR